MIKRLGQSILLCGIVLAVAAFPVFAQKNSGIRVNKKPLRDFAARTSNRVQKKELDLSGNFLIELSGELTKEGKFDLRKTKFIRSEGDEKMIDLAKSAIEAVNDSGVFAYLTEMDINKVDITLEQNDSRIGSIIKAEAVNDAKAKTLESLFNTAIIIGKANPGDGDDAMTILNGTKISVDDKFVIIETSVEKSVGQEIIRRELNKGTEKKAEIKPGK